METYTKTKLIEVDGNVATANGFYAGGLHCGIKRKRNDLGWLYSDVPANTAAVYTTNQFQAAPLVVTKESIQAEGKIQGLIVNSGVANACTGEEGLSNAYQMRHLFANKLGIADHLVAVNSTGVIGEQLPMEKLTEGIAQIDLTDSVQENFEKAILTTDTFTKHACVQTEIDGQQVIIGGAAKGSGMINPNMATMLTFLTTDAAIEPAALDLALKTAVDQTFNCITVDGDTSTNDTVMVMANGLANNPLITQQDSESFQLFSDALTVVCQNLAKQIARDGEGATKLIEVQVKGAKTHEDAQTISKTVVGSSLVKTAVFGADANWGRIICAIGYSGTEIDTNKVDVSIGNTLVVHRGMPVIFDEDTAEAYLQQKEEITIVIDLNSGNQEATAWGCDLSYDYVKINASYRT
ncbi:bifunctional ornithine acetyltransferase/N-acetylglutamate synthase [Lentibacillus sp. Marseille-P4043]|uniref:bifunctional ornithine acetyltransferase/N-acetylglutamate synthase n=1 Tax=Lentibacillus sp. Marseille-P4043 TaxID=2040293 RepID=UPI000D0AFCBB|nr:bifunctional ornithine acetyltransferase/N-acetylglutamate synthase [Lentibacillus sp. Marseille-P4043]